MPRVGNPGGNLDVPHSSQLHVPRRGVCVLPESTGTLRVLVASEWDVPSANEPLLAPAPSGASLPPRTVRSVFAPIVGNLASSGVEPKLLRTAAAYEYVTIFGNYTFSAAVPYVMNYSSPPVSNLFSWSAFLVGASTPGLATAMLPTNITVTGADNATFVVSYVPVYQGVAQGGIVVRFTFSAYVPPTFEVNFTQARTSGLLFNILWAVAGTPPYATSAGGSVLGLGSLSAPIRTASNNDSVTVGPSETPTW